MDMTQDQTTSAAQRILDERAQVLARVQTNTDETHGEELIVFRLGLATYSLPASTVLEVCVLSRYTPLPGTPSFVLGLVNIRGRLLSALDLRPLLNLAVEPLAPNALLLITSVKGTEMAFVADDVLDVRRTTGDYTQTLSAMAGHGTRWLRGVDKHFTLLIDLARLFDDPQISVNTSS